MGVWAAGLGLASVLAPAAGGQSVANPPVVTGSVQVTPNPTPVRGHSSPQLARNPKNGELVVAEVDIRNDRECQVHISTDSGRSWFLGGNMMVKPFTDCSIGAEYGTYFKTFFDSKAPMTRRR